MNTVVDEEKQMQTDSLVTSKTVKHRFGGVSDMTLWRWVKDGTLPQPIKIGKRNFWAESAIAETIAKLSGMNDAMVGDNR